MNISTLINKLEELKKEHGDLEVETTIGQYEGLINSVAMRPSNEVTEKCFVELSQ